MPDITSRARPSSHPILVVGAGIAGPVAAIALARAGFEATVYEASEAPRDDAGSFFNLAPNGIAVLRALGIDAVLDGIGFRNDRLVFQNERGDVLEDVAVGGLTLMRGALSRALRRAAEQHAVRFVFGKSVDTVAAATDGAIARFADGSVVRACAVIGADGVHSRTRASVLPHGPRPVHTGVLNLGGIVLTDLPSTGEAMHMVFGRRAFFGYAVRPSGETYWFSNDARRAEPAADVATRLPGEAIRERLLALHRGDPPEVARIIRAIEGEVGVYPVYELPLLPAWHRGPVCVIGDAAHAVGPHVGQGVSLALEDAFVVADCLAAHQDPSAAFQAFERARRDRIVPIVRQSRRTARQKAPAGWLFRRIRDLMLPMFLRQAAAGARDLYRSAPVPCQPIAVPPQSGQATGLAGFGSMP
jgi:2-polyprenyl-6-methoxyphenol hydroxylase-like FAD-dependent oxidoreductase